MMKIWLVAGAAGMALLAAGCAAGNSTASGPKPLSPAGTVRLAALDSQTISSEAATTNVNVTTDGTSVVMAGSVQVQRKPTLFVSADFTSVSAAGQSLAGGMQEIVTPSAIYMKMSELSSMTGKAWAEIPFSDLSGTKVADLGQMVEQAENSDPASQAQFLMGANGVRKVGTSVIGGVPVTEYTGHISMAEALSRFSPSLRAQVEPQIKQAGITGANFTAWIDAQYRVRKMVLNESGSSTTLAMTMTATSFNQPVSTALPAASQVYTIPASALGALK
jgi:hypothetical protein